MAGSTLEPEALDAVRRLAYLDGDRVSALLRLVETRQRAERDSRLAALQTALNSVQGLLKRASSERRSLEESLQDFGARVERTTTRLNSGQFTSPREVAAAEAEIAKLRAAIAESEDAVLALMVQEETFLVQQEAALLALNTETPRATLRQQAATAEATATEIRIKEIDAERRAAAQLLPAEARERYRALFPRTGGKPFAFAMAGQCGNCHHPLPGPVVQMLRAHQGVPSCPSCGRLLIEQS